MKKWFACSLAGIGSLELDAVITHNQYTHLPDVGYMLMPVRADAAFGIYKNVQWLQPGLSIPKLKSTLVAAS